MVTAACGGARVVSACAPHGLSYGHAAGRDSHLTWDRVDLEKSRIFLPGHLQDGAGMPCAAHATLTAGVSAAQSLD